MEKHQVLRLNAENPGMILLDANIVIYAEEREHIYRDPCQIIMDQVRIKPERYAIDAETLQEILYCYSRQGELDKGIRIVDELLARMPRIIPITVAEIRAASRLMRETPGLSSRHAIHAAVVVVHGLAGIISADRGFDRIPGLRRYDPADLAAGPGAGG